MADTVIEGGLGPQGGGRPQSRNLRLNAEGEQGYTRKSAPIFFPSNALAANRGAAEGAPLKAPSTKRVMDSGGSPFSGRARRKIAPA